MTRVITFHPVVQPEKEFGVVDAVVSAIDELRIVRVDPNLTNSERLAAGQLALILGRFEAGIPVGQAAISNLLRLSGGRS